MVRAVSVLPTPDGPQSMNTPTGLTGLSMPAREVCTRRAIISSPWSWPTTRRPSVAARFSTASASLRTMRPTGIPVQSCTTAATACWSTLGRISGCSPWWAAISVCRVASSASLVSRSATSGSRRAARRVSSLSTSVFSVSQRASSAVSSSAAKASAVATRSARSAVSKPTAASRSMMPRSVSSRLMRRRVSSTAAGTACWLMATRAAAVSSRLTDLSGSCRAGI